MIFAFVEDGTLEVYDTAADAIRNYEGIDVESGVVHFYDEAGTYLEPKFTTPNRSGKFLGLFGWVASGNYELVPNPTAKADSFALALHETRSLVPNACFTSLEQLKSVLAARGVAVDYEPVTAQMRQRVLSGDPAELAITPIGRVWGVLMEIGLPEGWASLVALADGTASLYLSSGGGMIGGGFHDSVANAAVDLCSLAAPLADLPAVTQFPTPAPGRIRFYVLTPDGVRTTEEAEQTLGAGEHELSALFMAGHEVITQLRLVSEAPGGD